MLHDAEKVAECRSWLDRAWADLDSAAILMAAVRPRPDTAVFHCQQAIEKTWKALLLARRPISENPRPARIGRGLHASGPIFGGTCPESGRPHAVCLAFPLSRRTGGAEPKRSRGGARHSSPGLRGGLGTLPARRFLVTLSSLAYDVRNLAARGRSLRAAKRGSQAVDPGMARSVGLASRALLPRAARSVIVKDSLVQ